MGILRPTANKSVVCITKTMSSKKLKCRTKPRELLSLVIMKSDLCSCYSVVFLSRYLCVYLGSCVESQPRINALVQHCPTLHLTAF